MGRFNAGGFKIFDDPYDAFTTDDFVDFYNDKGEIPEYDILNTWSVFLSSPWSQLCESYEIKVNCENGYTAIPEGTPIWRCEYTVLCCDGIYAFVFGYGNTEEEALADCKTNFKNIQEKYNKEKERI